MAPTTRTSCTSGTKSSRLTGRSPVRSGLTQRRCWGLSTQMTSRDHAADAARGSTMMSERTDDQYLEWLYGEVANVRTRSRSRTYWSLLRQMYSTEFVWWVPNDDNRCADGKDLRYEFIDACGIQTVDDEWLEMGCSVLEMLVALARGAAFE